MMLKITVVTITYNAAKVLQRTLDSVMQQTHRDVEHLIVDGASKDDTVELARRYQQQSDSSGNGHSVVITSEPDRGIYDAMNKGLRQATGDYIVFMNAGDTFHAHDTLARIAQLCEAADELPAVVYGDTHIVDGEGRFLYRRRLTPPERLSFYARRDVAQKTPYDLRYRFSADVDWCIRVMKEAAEKKLQLINSHEVVADYLEEGTTTQHHRASLRERFDVMRRHYGLPTTLLMHAWFIVRAAIHRR